ncbi:MAG TPA: Rad52/Rad22 family DNA repair protein [Gemmatimonadaceae bacterium]|nr:Rad52/Rad22 family DNA repair protein [Gemmatimonadaceae bacterium]
MIARHETQIQKTDVQDVWAQLAAPLPQGSISWRQDGRPVQRDGKFYARFVAYVDANTVRERLDSVVPGEWNLTIELLPPMPHIDEQLPEPPMCAFKARLQILGVVREDVGTGKDYKSAATDAFKRAAVRFGVANELYDYEQNWVRVDGDGRFAKPMEDPQVAYDRRLARTKGERAGANEDAEPSSGAPTLELKKATLTSDVPSCPKCGGRMWDNRIGKRNPKAPDFKCRDRSCDGVIWPAKPVKADAAPTTVEAKEEQQPPLALGTEEVPF